VKAEKWLKYNRLRKITESLYLPVLEELGVNDARRVRECGMFINIAECIMCGTKHYLGRTRCKSRFCIACQHDRSIMYIAKMIELVRRYLRGGGYIIKGVITIRDGQVLKNRLDFLMESWRKLTVSNRGTRKQFLRRFEGGIRSVEVKKGKNSKEWHPHMHLLMLKARYEKDIDWFIESWKQITNGEGSVFLQGVRIRKNEEYIDAVAEVVKYWLKPQLYSVEEFKELYECIKNKKMISSWGIVRKELKKADEDFGKGIDEEKMLAFICQRCGCSEYYVYSKLYSELKDYILYDIVTDSIEYENII